MSAGNRPWVSDASSSVVVFLVALPLCLGIAHGSGAPLMAGIVAGIVGGVVVGGLSRSALSVSGPAAGLIAVVAAAMVELNEWEVFAMALVLAGAIQFSFGVLRVGTLGEFIPNSVVRGMLAAIGILLVLKQVPHLIGYDADFEGDEGFAQRNDENTFSGIWHALERVSPPAAVIGIVSLGLIVLWESSWFEAARRVTRVPSALAAVLAGIAMQLSFRSAMPGWSLEQEHLVDIPPVTLSSLRVAFPDFSAAADLRVWRVALTLAVVASIESLLGVSAVDKLDPLRRVTPPNRELVAQGVGNVVSGFLGGLPVTSVIVRSAANVGAGAQSRRSTILHGVWLLLATLFAASAINQIPLAALAAVLIFTGFKLAKPALFREMYVRGPNQIIPFVITILGVVFTDLLVGILIGLGAGLVFVLRSNLHSSIVTVSDENGSLIRLRKDVTFLNKARFRNALESLPDGKRVVVDFSRADFVDPDVRDVLSEFVEHAHTRGILVESRDRGQSVTQATPLNQGKLVP